MGKFIILIILLFLLFSCANPYERKDFTAEEMNSISDLEQDLKVNPRDESTYQILGILYDRNNYVQKAMNCFEKAIELNPSNYEALAYLGMLKTKKGRELSGWYCFGINKINSVKSGIKDLNRAVESAPDNPGIRLYRVGTLISLKGKFSDYKVADQDLRLLEKNADISKLGYPASVKAHILYFRGKYIITYMNIQGVVHKEDEKKAIFLIKKSLDYFPIESPRRAEALDFLNQILKKYSSEERR